MKKNRSVALVEKTVKTCGGDSKKLSRELKRLVKEGKRSGDYILVGAAYCFLSENCYDTGDLSGLLANSIKAVALLKDSEEYELIARSYICLVAAYTNQENHNMALISDEIVLDVVRKHRIKGSIRLSILNNIAASYHMMGDVRKSIRIQKECLSLFEKLHENNDDDLAMYLINLAEYYKSNDETGEAQDVFKKMAPWIDAISFKPLICDYYLRRAIMSFTLGDTKAGKADTDKALTLIPDNLYPLPIYDDLRQISHFLSVDKDKERAEKLLNLMTVFAEKNTGAFEQIIAVRTMADHYKCFGDCKLATEYYAKYEELNDRHMREMNELQMSLHKTTKNAEIEIRKLKQKMKKNEELASQEPLTKLLNRSALLRVSSEFIEEAAKKKQKVGGIFIDIDFFKQCNDSYGHAKGDEIIREVARVCRRQETGSVRFARYGGDEFFGITRGLSDDEVAEIARRICRAIRAADIPNVNNPNGGRITLSVGVVNVTITDKTNTVLEVINYADKATYYAKNTGKNAIYKLDHGAGADNKTGNYFVKIDF